MSDAPRFASYPSLRERSVLITGGGSGIGAEIVASFVGQGARVAFLDVARDSSEALVARLGGAAGTAPLFVECDLTDVAALRRAVARVEERLGPLQVLVNNAAADDRHRIEDVTPEYWDRCMAVNLRQQFFAIQAVLPGMRRAGSGSIVNLGSIAWAIPSTGHVGYVTAKAGVMGLTRTLARELGPEGIRVNSVMPGGILTERQLRLWLTPEYKAHILERQSLKRHLYPDDVARLVLFLAADDSSAITNQSYAVDGGFI
jgi:NAD(P)-dependent dehydrogenase (short-subunit alcohol dehydrogenase family)